MTQVGTTAEPSKEGYFSERWQATLLSEDPGDQEWAVQWARAIDRDLRCSPSHY